MAAPENNASLMALSFVERLLMHDGHGAQVIARAIDDDDLGDMFYVVSTAFAALLDQTYGATGAVERVHQWRMAFLHPEQAAAWLE